MSTNKKIIIGALIIIGIAWLIKNKKIPWFNATYAPADKAGVGAEVTTGDDYYTGGGGSGYVPNGTDDSETQAADPDSYYEETVGDATPPIVGDQMSGLSGAPAVGTPLVPSVPGVDSPSTSPANTKSISQLTVGKTPGTKMMRTTIRRRYPTASVVR